MESKKLPWFGPYTVGLHDGTLVDSIVRGDLAALEKGFEGRSLDDLLILGGVTATPIGAAIASGRLDSLRWLIDQGARLDTEHVNAFLDAAYHGDPALLRELANGGADIHADRGFGDAFVRALYGKRTENLATIHELGHDVATYGGKALRDALFHENLEAVDFLLSHGADVDFHGADTVHALRETPLHVAVGTANLELVRRVVNAGADSQITDDLGNRPYDDAVQAGNLDLVDYLRQFEPAERHTREWVLDSAAAKGLPGELVEFLESDDRVLRSASRAPTIGYIDFLELTETVPVRVGRTRTVLRLSREMDRYPDIWIVWSPRLQRVGAVVGDLVLKFFRLGTWNQFRADPFEGIDRILSGEAKPTSA